ncbi:MAG: hypothetical protein AAGH99_03710 [Planctomycetota bacterium]
MSNNTQLRGIHQAFVTFAQSNKRGGYDGYFPGLDASGRVIPDGEDTFFSGDGTFPAARLVMLLNGNYFTPEYVINPADTRAIETTTDTGDYERLLPENYSYALLEITGALTFAEDKTRDWSQYGRAIEWQETLNTAAIVMSDRAIGTGRDDMSSVWTETGSGDWRGGVVRNDNSTSFETTTEFEDTKYGNAAANNLDHLFEDAAGAVDAFLVFEDATTAYSDD